MPKSTIFLPDVNVSLALASERYVHALRCSRRLDSIHSEVAFCRITQMGLLRLLTHESVMGSDVLALSEAWRVYRTILADERVHFAPEPLAVEQEWRKFTMQDRPMPKIWADAYLAAFARAAGMQLGDSGSRALALASEALLISDR